MTEDIKTNAAIDELIEGLLNDRKNDIEELFSIFYKKVFLNCLRIVREKNAAEDLTHETFLKVLRYRRTFDKKYRFLYWILKISTNECFMYLKEKRKDDYYQLHIEELELDDGNINRLQAILTDKKAQVEMENRIDTQFIIEAINMLPPIYGIPIFLKYYNDLSYEEIAGVLDVQIGTIKFRLNKAKNYLAKIITGFEEQE